MAKAAPATDVVYPWLVKSNHGTCNYEVLLHETGSMSCNCPGWIYKRKAERGCTHTRELTNEGARIYDLYIRGEALPPRRVAAAYMSDIKLATNTDGRVFLEDE